SHRALSEHKTLSISWSHYRQRAGGEGILTTIYGILVFLPWWAVQFRRLHDTDRSAWWALLFLIPFIGWLIIIVFNCQAGTPGENRFGPDPKLEP
nr:DUF805 domain-containing protein [Escherichia coli]